MRGIELRDPGESGGALWTRQQTPAAGFVTEAGIHFRAVLTAPIPSEDLEAVAIKFLRGCYYEHAGKALPADADCWAVTFDDDPTDVIEPWSRVPGAITAGDFPFSYAFAVDRTRTNAAGATFLLWDSIHLFAAANLPRTRPG